MSNPCGSLLLYPLRATASFVQIAEQICSGSGTGGDEGGGGGELGAGLVWPLWSCCRSTRWHTDVYICLLFGMYRLTGECWHGQPRGVVLLCRRQEQGCRGWDWNLHTLVANIPVNDSQQGVARVQITHWNDRHKGVKVAMPACTPALESNTAATNSNQAEEGMNGPCHALVPKLPECTSSLNLKLSSHNRWYADAQSSTQ